MLTVWEVVGSTYYNGQFFLSGTWRYVLQQHLSFIKPLKQSCPLDIRHFWLIRCAFMYYYKEQKNYQLQLLLILRLIPTSEMLTCKNVPQLVEFILQTLFVDQMWIEKENGSDPLNMQQCPHVPAASLSAIVLHLES